MRHKLTAIAFSTLLIALFIAVPAAWADSGNQKIDFTLNVPVNVAGHVLAPGKYEMKFADDQDYNVVQISTASGARAIGYFEVIPVVRSRNLSQVKLRLTEPAAGQAPRLKAFFYPGDATGYEFEHRGIF